MMKREKEETQSSGFPLCRVCIAVQHTRSHRNPHGTGLFLPSSWHCQGRHVCRGAKVIYDVFPEELGVCGLRRAEAIMGAWMGWASGQRGRVFSLLEQFQMGCGAQHLEEGQTATSEFWGMLQDPQLLRDGEEEDVLSGCHHTILVQKRGWPLGPRGDEQS